MSYSFYSIDTVDEVDLSRQSSSYISTSSYIMLISIKTFKSKELYVKISVTKFLVGIMSSSSSFAPRHLS